MIISVPSYVIPGTYGENIVFLAERSEIEAVELLFFYFDKDSQDLFIREKDLIVSYRDRFAYSVHMPDTLLPEHERLVELTCDLAARYIVHSPATDVDEFYNLLADWQSRYNRTFLVENLIDRDVPAIEKMNAFSLCCDTGHLLLGGANVAAYLQRHGPRIEEIHLHGVRDGSDHRSFPTAEPWFQDIVPYLDSFTGVVNIEVFSINEVEAIESALIAAGLMSA